MGEGGADRTWLRARGVAIVRSSREEPHEQTQSHCHLRHHRLDPYAVDVAPPAGDGRGDRRSRHRRGRGGRGDRPSARARSRRRTPRSVATGFRAIPQGDQAALELRGQHHHRRRPDDDDRGTPAAGRHVQAGSRLAQHGLDEFRPFSDARAVQGTSIILGSGPISKAQKTASSRTRLPTSSTS